MTGEEASKLDQLLIALETSEEANSAFQETILQRIEAITTEVKGLSRAVDGYVREMNKLARDYRYIVSLLRLTADEKLRDTLPSPPPSNSADEEPTHPGHGG